MAITLRQESNAQATTKGSALTFAELDNNFIHVLNNGIIVVGDDSTGTEFTLGNTLTVAGGTGITTAVSGNTLTITSSVTSGLNDIVEDTTPQLGGNLDVNGNNIVSVSNGNIVLAPNGTGIVQVDNSQLEIYDDTSAVDYNNYGDFALKIYDAGTGANISIGQYLNGPAVSGAGANIQYFTLQFDSTGTYSLPDSSAFNGDVGMFFGYNFDNGENLFYSGGGPMSFDAFGTNGDGYAQQPITFEGSENKFNSELVFLKTYKETVTTLTSSATIAVDCSATSVSRVALGTNTQFTFNNLPEGRSHTLIIVSSGSYTATFDDSTSTAVKFPGGAPTITDSGTDVVTVFNTGSEILGNIVQDYQ